MSFIRHVGKHGDRKVAVIFREVPGESHMCLVTYTEILNRQMHDALVKCIESDIGQQAESLADALSRTLSPEGNPILQTLHVEGKLKKVNTENIIMTPAPNTKIKLNELNKILDEMKLGEDAIKKLSDMDNSLGMQSHGDVVRKMRGPKQPSPAVVASGDLLGDAALANQRLEQATRMKNEAKGLLAEAKRLSEEAKTLDPSISKAAKTVKTATAPVTAPIKARRTRAKVTV